MPYVLQTNHLSKTIGHKDIVTDVDIHIKQGDIYGFLGPNGAGKTTVMKMITNLWKPTSGTIEIFGETLTPTSYEVLKRMGSIIEFPVFYDKLSAWDNLMLHCEYMGYYNPGSVSEVLETLGLKGTGNKEVGSFSLGMRQRLGIARAIITKPQLLILDEPTNGLDPAGMKEIRDLIKMLSRDYGITVMISSHILSEIETLVDTIGVIHHGEMKKEISMNDVLESNLAYVKLEVNDTTRASYILSDKLGLTNFKVNDKNIIRIYDMKVSTQELTKTLALNDVDIISLGRKTESLEDYFLKLTTEVEKSC